MNYQSRKLIEDRTLERCSSSIIIECYSAVLKYTTNLYQLPLSHSSHFQINLIKKEKKLLCYKNIYKLEHLLLLHMNY